MRSLKEWHKVQIDPGTPSPWHSDRPLAAFHMGSVKVLARIASTLHL